GFEEAVDRVAGATQLQVSAGENGLPEDVLEQVQSLEEVSVASPAIEAVVESEVPGQGSILILAVDMTGDTKLRRYEFDSAESGVEDPLVFMARANSILIGRPMAERAGLSVGSTVPLRTMQGTTRFTVRGILRGGGLASA